MRIAVRAVRSEITRKRGERRNSQKGNKVGNAGLCVGNQYLDENGSHLVTSVELAPLAPNKL